MKCTYDEEFRESIADPVGFWSRQASGMDWEVPAERVFDETVKPASRWFVG